MRKRWVTILGSLFLSWGLSTASAQTTPAATGGGAMPGPTPPLLGPTPPAAGSPSSSALPATTPLQAPAPASGPALLPPPGQATPPPIGQVGPGQIDVQPTPVPPNTAAPPAALGGGNCGNGCGGCGGLLDYFGSWFSGWDTGAPLGISAGGGVYYMMPYFSSNPAFFSKSGPGGNTVHETDADTHLSIAPTGYISWAITCDWAIKARWWQIETNGNATAGGGGTILDGGGFNTGTGASAGATTNFNSTLYISWWNLDIAHRWQFGNGSWIEASGGFAYVHTDQSASLFVTDPVTGRASSIANHNFNGFGPTVAFEGHYRLGCSDFGLYGSLRGTLLFGSCDQNYYAVAASGATAIGGSSSSCILPVGEMEVGAEWNHKCGRFILSAQIGVVGQIWLNGGNAVYGSNIANDPGAQSNSPANFGFIGGVARAGITF